MDFYPVPLQIWVCVACVLFALYALRLPPFYVQARGIFALELLLHGTHVVYSTCC